MRMLGHCLVSACLLLVLEGPAVAVPGTIDAVPAATLLLPYFEVDLAQPEGIDTLFSINNSADTAVLAHVTLWTDQSVPALDFDVYLTGYDIQTLSLRDILVNGNLPVTATSGQDPADTISPQGSASQDINFASCSSLPYPTPAVSALFRAHLQAWLQGYQSPATGDCAGSKRQDGILRGYITIDTVSSCSLFSPSDWDLYSSILTDQNVLWGDVIYLDPSDDSAQGMTLVSIEACPTCYQAGDHTFYGRYNAASAEDGREPLPLAMAGRFINTDSEFLIWREANHAASGYSCTLQGPASWYPLEPGLIVLFDEAEQSLVYLDDGAVGDDVDPLPAQRINVSTNLASPFSSGWVLFALQHPDVIPEYGDEAQMWMSVLQYDGGRFSMGYGGIQLLPPLGALCQWYRLHCPTLSCWLPSECMPAVED